MSEQPAVLESGMKLVYGVWYSDGKPYLRWALAYQDGKNWVTFDGAESIREVGRQRARECREYVPVDLQAFIDAIK